MRDSLITWLGTVAVILMCVSVIVWSLVTSFVSLAATLPNWGGM